MDSTYIQITLEQARNLHRDGIPLVMWLNNANFFIKIPVTAAAPQDGEIPEYGIIWYVQRRYLTSIYKVFYGI
jgi:hypothetical protein